MCTRHPSSARAALYCRFRRREERALIVEQIWTGNAYRNFNYLIACPETVMRSRSTRWITRNAWPQRRHEAGGSPRY
jgi:hypothetical protein